MDSLILVILRTRYMVVWVRWIAFPLNFKAKDDYVPRDFFCRKRMYALLLQTAVDRNLRFMHMSGICCGSTHDSVAFSVSTLSKRLQYEGILPEY